MNSSASRQHSQFLPNVPLHVYKRELADHGQVIDGVRPPNTGNEASLCQRAADSREGIHTLIVVDNDPVKADHTMVDDPLNHVVDFVSHDLTKSSFKSHYELSISSECMIATAYPSVLKKVG
jgi:hypothetical protein